MMTLLDLFRERLADLELKAGPALVAVSGGRDSVVLLDLLVATKATHGLELVVTHVDHGISEDSAEVAGRVRALASQYGLPFSQTRFDLGPDTTETEARRRRYAWLEAERQAQGAAVIFLAHHADDQAETVLMRALAGSGPAGLAGMAPRQGPYARPLLGFGRDELERYAVEGGLSWWDDPANADPQHLRSWLRIELLPRLRARIPDIEPRLLKVGEQARVDRGAWNALLDALPALECRREPDGCSVAAPVLARYDWALAATLLQALARRAGCVLGWTRAERVLRMV
ncbi:MAG: tRNA lysidine(34) synthetase TilS, partial [Gemmatimonadales bacterium]|nr:tRNA lysidine(34) synthetase TilS [Gemmatimonadales bacterium]